MHGSQAFLYGDILSSFRELSRERVEFLNATLNSFFSDEEGNISSFATQTEERKLLENHIHEKYDILIRQTAKMKRDIDAIVTEDELLWKKVIDTKAFYFKKEEDALELEYQKIENEAEMLKNQTGFYTKEVSAKFQRLASLGRRLSRLQKNKEDAFEQLNRIMELRKLLEDIGELEE